jgi:NTP pyrophosphatase (non-canonical NTP hydrolase)
VSLPTRKELKAMTFIQAFEELQTDAAEINKNAGFSFDDLLLEAFEFFLMSRMPLESYEQFKPLLASFRNARTGLKLALIMGELGEALEAVRKNLGPDEHIPGFSAEEVEIADAVIRLMNYATDRKLRLAEAIFAKNEYNRTRHDHSKAGRAEEHGKKF